MKSKAGPIRELTRGIRPRARTGEMRPLASRGVFSNGVKVFSLGVSGLGLEKRIKFIANQILIFFKKEKHSLEVYLIDGRRMRFINRRFRGKDAPTNVLSFEAVSPKLFFEVKKGGERGIKDLGEVYLCPSFISRRGEKLERLLIHGILHLLHYQHDKKNDTIVMERLEAKIFKKFGID